jgi:hypothetical protein
MLLKKSWDKKKHCRIGELGQFRKTILL